MRSRLGICYFIYIKYRHLRAMGTLLPLGQSVPLQKYSYLTSVRQRHSRVEMLLLYLFFAVELLLKMVHRSDTVET